MNKWTKLTVSEIADKKRNSIVGGPFGSDLVSKDYTTAGVPVIRGINMGCGRWVAGDFVYVSEEKAASLASNCAEPDDLIFTQRGTIGQVALIPQNEFPRYLISQSQMKLSVDPEKADSLFLYYIFIGKQQQKYIQQNAIRTGVPHTNLSILKDTPVILPPLSKQKQISSFVNAIDSKIELNNKINAELEAMAKLIYDYWFVQFDFPDANGKPYKSSGGKMVYNEELKREIPDGWESTNLGAICELYQPKTISEKEMDENGKYLVYGANGVVGKYSQFNHEKSVVTITCRGNSCGTLNTTRPYSWITGNAMVVNAKCETMHAEFIYNMLGWSNLDTVISGSAQPQITRTNLAPLRLLLPPKSKLAEYNKLVASSFEKRLIAANENDQLMLLRDWLLPMLMNGQVTIKQ